MLISVGVNRSLFANSIIPTSCVVNMSVLRLHLVPLTLTSKKTKNDAALNCS